MLSNEHHRQHRSLLQTSKITNMLKQTISGTLSPETTTTTSSGYSTGGSSVSTIINPSLKKSPSIACKQDHHQQQQQQHKTKSKGKKKKNIIHVVKEPIYALAISIVLLQMTFTIYFSSIHHLNIVSISLSIILFSSKAEKDQYITIVLICQHLSLVEIILRSSLFSM
jgi:hypothetical protein